MTFTIREMLALVLLFALGLLAWRSSEAARREQANLAQLHGEIKNLEARVRLDQPAIHQAILHTAEEFEPLRAMRERSLAHFDVLRQKYSTMEPRGEDLLSIRSIPALQTDSGPAPVIYRLLVPKEPSIWLKFGVQTAQESRRSPGNQADNSGWLTTSPFKASGPFEMQLPPGDQRLTIAIGSARNGVLPLEISLNEKVLLRSPYVLAEVAGTGSSRISALSQVDLDPRQKFNRLMAAEISLREPTSKKEHAFSVWFSGRASNFKSFPGE